MPAETLKYGDGGLKVHLRNICNHVLRSATSPRQWKENPIVSIPKNASSKMTDFRVITLMSVAAKTFNRLLLNRLYPVLNERLRVYQARFRKKRNCTEQFLFYGVSWKVFIRGTSRWLSHLLTSKKPEIDRAVIWAILKHYGVPPKMIAAIKCLYDDSVSISI